MPANNNTFEIVVIVLLVVVLGLWLWAYLSKPRLAGCGSSQSLAASGSPAESLSKTVNLAAGVGQPLGTHTPARPMAIGSTRVTDAYNMSTPSTNPNVVHKDSFGTGRGNLRDGSILSGGVVPSLDGGIVAMSDKPMQEVSDGFSQMPDAPQGDPRDWPELWDSVDGQSAPGPDGMAPFLGSSRKETMQRYVKSTTNAPARNPTINTTRRKLLYSKKGLGLNRDIRDTMNEYYRQNAVELGIDPAQCDLLLKDTLVDCERVLNSGRPIPDLHPCTEYMEGMKTIRDEDAARITTTGRGNISHRSMNMPR